MKAKRKKENKYEIFAQLFQLLLLMRLYCLCLDHSVISLLCECIVFKTSEWTKLSCRAIWTPLWRASMKVLQIFQFLRIFFTFFYVLVKYISLILCAFRISPFCHSFCLFLLRFFFVVGINDSLIFTWRRLRIYYFVKPTLSWRSFTLFILSTFVKELSLQNTSNDIKCSHRDDFFLSCCCCCYCCVRFVNSPLIQW